MPEPVPTGPVGTLRLPAQVHVGDGSRARLADVVRQLGSRPLVVADPFLAGTPTLEALLAPLADGGLAVRVHSDIVPELPVDSLETAAALAVEHHADVVVAVGGGSALDAAKLIALLAVHGGPLSRYYGENQVPGPVLPVVALPTTAGTGSEVTPVAVVSDPGRALKVGVSSPHLVPAVALVDPELTHGAPRSVTAHAGIDALVHAFESYTARPLTPSWDAVPPVFTGRNALTDAVSLRAAAHLGRWLPEAVRHPDDRQARAEVATGSLLGGIAFGSTGTHLCHALQYPIGALTHTPHGLGTGLMLPYVVDALLRRRHSDLVERVATFGAALGADVADTAPDVAAERTVRRLVDICAEIELPPTLADLGVGRDDLPRIADLGLQSSRLVAIAPVEVDHDLLLEILSRAHQGALTARSTA